MDFYGEINKKLKIKSFLDCYFEPGKLLHSKNLSTRYIIAFVQSA